FRLRDEGGGLLVTTPTAAFDEVGGLLVTTPTAAFQNTNSGGFTRKALTDTASAQFTPHSRIQ
ncbi:MAG TPA: hypothetical protein VLL95_10680, partial [Phnomibacter sp.]|nr:hypothetical protein [Phnomibacter sp.]